MVESSPLELGKRERQIVEILYRRGEASVGEVREALAEPPTYSAVRGMLNLLADKGVVRFRRDGKRYIYRPAAPKQKTGRSVLRNLVHTFFAGQPAEAVAALVDGWGGKLSPADLARIRQLIDDAEAKRPLHAKEDKP
ncbi:MAG TPA: BlaI/MecI/CopY family transcriptional regulator [Pirellulales bacterium]|nr:BlaI/MecI/CopY family transcriptional regulator [Pirellulales bacterium]